MKSLLIVLFVSFLFGSCAQIKTKNSTKKVYSQETQSTFEDIEKERAIESYRQLRLKNWQRYNKKKKRSSRRVYKRKITKKIKRVRRRPLVNPIEQKNEIDQNLTYYCMKNRKNSKFDEESDCKLFTSNVFKKCSETNNLDEPELLSCIKTRLR